MVRTKTKNPYLTAFHYDNLKTNPEYYPKRELPPPPETDLTAMEKFVNLFVDVNNIKTEICMLYIIISFFNISCFHVSKETNWEKNFSFCHLSLCLNEICF
jgi:hypothetical protein